MRTVGMKTLKNKLSERVRAATAGETVVITDRGRPVAEINPPRQVPIVTRAILCSHAASGRAGPRRRHAAPTGRQRASRFLA